MAITDAANVAVRITAMSRHAIGYGASRPRNVAPFWCSSHVVTTANAVPGTMPSAAMNVLSTMNARWMARAQKPTARSTPIVRPLPHGADHHDAQAGYPDQQAEGDEALHEAEEAEGGGEILLDLLADADGHEAGGEVLALRAGGEGALVDARRGSDEEAGGTRRRELGSDRFPTHHHRVAELAGAGAGADAVDRAGAGGDADDHLRLDLARLGIGQEKATPGSNVTADGPRPAPSG